MKHNPWPFAIIAYFVLFITAMISSIVFAVRNDQELVRKDYYEQELKFQNEIDSSTRAAAVPFRMDYQPAGQKLDIALPPDSRNAAVHFFFGMVSVEENLLEEAYKSLKQAVTLAPNNADYNYALGIVAQRRADPSEAVPFFKKYCVLRPDDARGRLQLGITYFYSHQEDLAEKELRAAIEHRETAAAAHFFLGRIANQEGKFSQALHELQQATTVEPNYADPYAEQGIIYMKQKAYAPAAQALLRALAIDPDHYAANLNLMMLYQRTGDTRAGEQARRFEEVKKKRAERARLSLRSIEIVR